MYFFEWGILRLLRCKFGSRVKIIRTTWKYLRIKTEFNIGNFWCSLIFFYRKLSKNKIGYSVKWYRCHSSYKQFAGEIFKNFRFLSFFTNWIFRMGFFFDKISFISGPLQFQSKVFSTNFYFSNFSSSKYFHSKFTVEKIGWNFFHTFLIAIF